MENKRTKTDRYEESNYLAGLLSACQAIRGDAASFVIQVRHDDWCDLLNGRGFCNCEPEICSPKRFDPI